MSVVCKDVVRIEATTASKQYTILLGNTDCIVEHTPTVALKQWASENRDPTPLDIGPTFWINRSTGDCFIKEDDTWVRQTLSTGNTSGMEWSSTNW